MGLGIHPDKTKILSNQGKEEPREIKVDNIKIEVLSKGDSARYRGQKKITFEEQETEEIKNRLKAAWAAFHKYRQELTSKDYRRCHRLRLFGMVITHTTDLRKWKRVHYHKNTKELSRPRNDRCFALIVQTKSRYKSKNKKEAADGTAEETKVRRSRNKVRD